MQLAADAPSCFSSGSILMVDVGGGMLSQLTTPLDPTSLVGLAERVHVTGLASRVAALPPASREVLAVMACVAGGIMLIAGRLAVSLDNALIHASLERKVADRTEQLAAAN